VYANPEYIETLSTSTAIADHVDVDFELRGCPVSKYQLLEVVAAFLLGRKPNVPTYSVCVECKLKGNPCILVAHGTPCLGPVTQAGCDALCPTYDRGCFGCYGPMESPNTASLADKWTELGVDERELVDAFRSYNAWAGPFREAGDRHEAMIEIGGAR
jgi:coenzyme F420-reducing hydrogenase gamma subunit